MAISKNDIIVLMNAFHDTVMFENGDAEAQGRFFLHPEPRIFIPHGADLTLQDNYEIHQKLTDEQHRIIEPLDVTPLCDDPERARAVCAVYWQGRGIGTDESAIIKCVVGEDWIVQRTALGDLKIALYVNSYHHFLPDSVPISFS
jgi:hypothetical protein